MRERALPGAAVRAKPGRWNLPSQHCGLKEAWGTSCTDLAMGSSEAGTLLHILTPILPSQDGLPRPSSLNLQLSPLPILPLSTGLSFLYSPLLCAQSQPVDFISMLPASGILVGLAMGEAPQGMGGVNWRRWGGHLLSPL